MNFVSVNHGKRWVVAWANALVTGMPCLIYVHYSVKPIYQA